jgi:NAD(P)-dependent dehydrogenase (short-subunit alcohol dehydrogenase family)/acyl dehydratase
MLAFFFPPICNMKFTAAHVETFCKASHDTNPLHVDPAYAKRSQFGNPVVYGMAAVLYGLGEWAQGSPFRLRSLRAVFRKPLFVGEEYDLQFSHDGEETRFSFKKGIVDYAVVTFVAERTAETHFVTSVSDSSILHTAIEFPLIEARSVRYAMGGNIWEELAQTFRIMVGMMPLVQLTALLWSSYLVGMEVPGRQALFSDVDFEFDAVQHDAAEIEMQLEAADFDDRFNRYVIEGKGSGIASVRISAFARPNQVDFPMAGMAAFAEGNLPLAGKVVFVSGAARGFGAAIARMCALAGARLALNYRGDEAAIVALRDEIRLAGGEAEAFAADLSNPQAAAAMAHELQQTYGQLDLIVNNAAPPIRDLLFLEQGNADIQGFVNQNLAITLETARNLLPLVPKGGQFVHISTKYLATPARGFIHYLAAKAAQEAIVQGLSLEFRLVEFVTTRLPRILTDQTNLPFDFDPPARPDDVARALVLAIASPLENGNFRLLELY